LKIRRIVENGKASVNPKIEDQPPIGYYPSLYQDKDIKSGKLKKVRNKGSFIF